MNIITLNRVLLNNTPLNYRRKRILTEKDFYFKTIERTFTFSKSAGGKSIKDGRAYIKRIKGNSVVWNQLWDVSKASVQDGTMSEENGIVSILPTGSFPGLKQITTYDLTTKKLLVIAQSSANSLRVNAGGQDSVLTKIGTTFYAIVTGGSRLEVTIYSYNATESFTISDIRICDLTKAFPNDWENINTIEDFNARVATLGVDLNAYNEGQVIHCNTESIKSVGDNAWDEEWESGIISYNSGIETNSANHCRTVGYTQVIPNEQYYISFPTASATSSLVVICYDENKAFIKHIGGGSANKTFTIPANCHYIRFTWEGTEYNNNIMITLVHSGWKQDTDAGYQPYWQDTLPLPIINKYFPDGMKSAGSAHDEIRYNKASGKWEKVVRIGEVDMGDMEWTLTPQMYFRALLPSDSIAPTNTDYNGFICAKYERVDFNLIYGQRVASPCFGIPGNNPVCCVADSSYTDAATFKAAMQGVMLYYELAEPIVTELDEADQNFRDYYNVADFGTEMSQSAVPSAALLADVGYYFKKSEVKELTLN